MRLVVSKECKPRVGIAQERIGAYARTEGGHFLQPTMSVCVILKWKFVYPLNYGFFSILAACFFLKHTMVAPG